MALNKNPVCSKWPYLKINLALSSQSHLATLLPPHISEMYTEKGFLRCTISDWRFLGVLTYMLKVKIQLLKDMQEGWLIVNKVMAIATSLQDL